MALWTEYFRDIERKKQAARASGRQVLSASELAGAAAPVAATTMAEESGLAAEEGRRLEREELATGAERFAGRLGLARTGLALGKERVGIEAERAGIEAELGRGRLGLAEKEYEHMKSMGPWAIGLGATELTLAGMERAKQQKRDEAYWRLLRERMPSDFDYDWDPAATGNY